MLLEALEVQLRKDLDSDELSDVEALKWQIIGSSKDSIVLQINFESPENVSFISSDYITVTFYGTEFFKSWKGLDVEFGTQLSQKI